MNLLGHVVAPPGLTPTPQAVADEYFLFANEATSAAATGHHAAACGSYRKLLFLLSSRLHEARACQPEVDRCHEAALASLRLCPVEQPPQGADSSVDAESINISELLDAAAGDCPSLSFLQHRSSTAQQGRHPQVGEKRPMAAMEEERRKGGRTEAETMNTKCRAPMKSEPHHAVHVLSGGTVFQFGDKPPRQNVPVPQPSAVKPEGFLTATEQLQRDIACGRAPNIPHRPPQLGLRRFQPPLLGDAAVATPQSTNQVPMSKVISATVKPHQQTKDSDSNDTMPESLLLPDGSIPPVLMSCEPKLVHQICLEIVESGGKVEWSDIAGLAHAKQAVEETVVWPLLNPELFTGVRSSCRGLLLFGPPGTGKTMIARAIASRAECTFLNISSSSLMSKWVGEGEKMVRCLFAVAAVKQPSVVFIDEIDSLLSLRSEGEMDAVRRVKTEFLVQLDGVGTNAASRVLLIGATNRPEELDEAARRRLEKRLYIPLPELESRRELVSRLMSKDDLKHSLTIADFEAVAAATDGYSGADLSALCREAAMGPLRAVMGTAAKVSIADIRPVCLKDFTSALKRQKPSVGKNEVQRYLKWNAEYGSFDLTEDD